jgi:hypothetical protein
MGALCCSLFSTPVYPLRHDPNLPSQSIYEHSHDTRPNGDDTSWDDPLRSYDPGANNGNQAKFVEPAFYSFPQFVRITWFVFLRLLNDRDVQGIDPIQLNTEDEIRTVE